MTQTDSHRTIAIIEDDPEICRIIQQTLDEYGFLTSCFRTGGDFLRRLNKLTPDLCIIDLGLPDMDGLEALRQIRAQSTCGNLILTGRAHISDRVMGLEMGADDYVVKPFEPRELVARVRSILRRREESQSPQAMHVARFAGWQFNTNNHVLLSPTNEQSALSIAEAELLKVFIRHPNRILHREKLMGSRDLDPTDRSIDVRISRLRRKLEPDEQSPELIKTVYGAGYLFLASVTWSDNDAATPAQQMRGS